MPARVPAPVFSVTRDKIVFNLSDRTGNNRMLKPEPGSSQGLRPLISLRDMGVEEVRTALWEVLHLFVAEGDHRIHFHDGFSGSATSTSSALRGEQLS